MVKAKIASRAASVRFENVTKDYGPEIRAVDNVNLTVEAGELVTLLGPSGCGKTTTLRMIAGLEMLTSGSVFIGDKNVTQLPATDRDVSMVFQSYALFPHMTVGENVAYGLTASKMEKSEITARAEAGLELVGLADFWQRLPSELSGGQQQRVAVARAIVLEPQVLLFDEPLSNLDAKLRRQVREEIRDIQRNLGLTVVYVTHDQEEALAVSDRIIVMNNAVIAQAGTPRDLYEAPNSRFVADFIGEANILDCEITAVKAGKADIRIGAMKLSLPAADLKPGKALLAVRPRRVLLKAPGQKSALKGKLKKATYVGSHIEYLAATEAGDIFVIAEDIGKPFKVDDNVSVGFASRGPVLLPK